MSVGFNQYIIVGVKLPCTEETPYEMFEEYIDNGHRPGVIHKNGLAVVYDGMDNKFIMLGRIMEKSRYDEPLDGQFSLDPVDPEKAELLSGLMNLSFAMVPVSHRDIKTWFVTHYH